MKQHTRLVGVGAVLVLGLTGLVGCNSSDSPSGTKAAGQGSGQGAAQGSGSKAAGSGLNVTQALDLVAKSTDGANSAKVQMVEKVPGVGTITASGVVAWNPTAIDMTMDMSGVKGAASGQLSTVQMKMSGMVMYMNMGDKAAASFKGKHWLKIDLKDVAKTGAVGQQLTDQFNKQTGQSPTEGITLLIDSGNVKAVGKETVNGVETTRYKGTVDIAKFAEKQGTLGGMSAEDRKQFESEMRKAGVKVMDIELWVDSSNLPIKVHETADTAKGPLDITATYTDYGTPVSVTVPAASDTLDLGKMLGDLQGTKS